MCRLLLKRGADARARCRVVRTGECFAPADVALTQVGRVARGTWHMARGGVGVRPEAMILVRWWPQEGAPLPADVALTQAGLRVSHTVWGRRSAAVNTKTEDSTDCAERCP